MQCKWLSNEIFNEVQNSDDQQQQHKKKTDFSLIREPGELQSQPEYTGTITKSRSRKNLNAKNPSLSSVSSRRKKKQKIYRKISDEMWFEIKTNVLIHDNEGDGIADGGSAQ